MTIKVAALADASPADVTAWEDLAAHAIEPNVWVEPPFLLEYAASLPGGADVQVVYDQDADGQWNAVLFWTPEKYSLRGGDFPVASTHGRFLSPHIARQPLLVRAEGAVGTLAELLDALGTDGLPGALALDNIPAGRLLETLHSAAGQVGALVVERPRGHMARATARTTAESFWGVLRDATPDDDAYIGYALKKLTRFGRRIGQSVAIEDWSDRPDIIDVFAEFEARGWKGDPMRGGSGMVVDPGRKEVFERIADGFRDRGRLRVHALHADGEPLYMGIDLGSAAGSYFGIANTYDERVSKERPGVMGQLASVLAVAHGPDAVDFDPSVDPENPQPDRVYRDIVTASSALVVRRGVRARSLVRAGQWVARAKVGVNGVKKVRA